MSLKRSTARTDARRKVSGWSRVTIETVRSLPTTCAAVTMTPFDSMKHPEPCAATQQLRMNYVSADVTCVCAFSVS